MKVINNAPALTIQFSGVEEIAALRTVAHAGWLTTTEEAAEGLALELKMAASTALLEVEETK